MPALARKAQTPARLPPKRGMCTPVIAELPQVQPLPSKPPALRWSRPFGEEIPAWKEARCLCSRHAPNRIVPACVAPAVRRSNADHLQFPGAVISIFGAQLVRRGHVLVDTREATTAVQKDVVRLVVIDRRDLPSDRSSGAALRPELVVEIRRQRNGHTRLERKRVPRLDPISNAIQRNLDVLVRERIAGRAVVDAAQEIAAGSADDVLGLSQVMMHRRMLILTYDQDLLCIPFSGIGSPLMMSIANGKHHQPDLLEAARTEISDVPSQLAVPDLIALRALLHPFAGRPIRERRQPDLMLVKQSDRIVDQRIDLGPFHAPSRSR